MTLANDKRLHPRVSHKITVRAAHNGGVDFETINLSAGGLFCTSPAWVSPMTRMALALTLPAVQGNGPAVVEGEAVVVRTEPHTPSTSHQGGYRIALFFSRMDEGHRKTLQQFLQARAE
jgi:c-di-GMP-binding flagellar brake protein YcgR